MCSLGHINELYEHYKDYIHSFELTIEGRALAIKYTPWAYDLIDADLDFDEAYYLNMISGFDRFIHSYAQELIKNADFDQLTVNKKSMIFRNDCIEDYVRSYKIHDGRICITTQTHEYV